MAGHFAHAAFAGWLNGVRPWLTDQGPDAAPAVWSRWPWWWNAL